MATTTVRYEMEKRPMLRIVTVVITLLMLVGLPARATAQRETVIYFHTDAVGSVRMTTDANGQVQPTAEDLANKKTFLEDNSQHPRKVMVS